MSLEDGDLDMQAVHGDDRLLDALAARQPVACDEPIVSLLAALAADVDTSPTPIAAATPRRAALNGHGAVATLVANPTRRLFGRSGRLGPRVVVALGVAGTVLGASGVAAAVTGDPLAPIEKVITTVTNTVNPPKSKAVRHTLNKADQALSRGDTATASRLLSDAHKQIQGAKTPPPAEVTTQLAVLDFQLARQTASATATPSIVTAPPTAPAPTTPVTPTPAETATPTPTDTPAQQTTSGSTPTETPSGSPSSEPSPTPTPSTTESASATQATSASPSTPSGTHAAEGAAGATAGAIVAAGPATRRAAAGAKTRKAKAAAGGRATAPQADAASAEQPAGTPAAAQAPAATQGQPASTGSSGSQAPVSQADPSPDSSGASPGGPALQTEAAGPLTDPLGTLVSAVSSLTDALTGAGTIKA